jgi:uncharacterized protein (DUF58 family)
MASRSGRSSRTLRPAALLLIGVGIAFSAAALIGRAPQLLFAALPLFLAPVAAWSALGEDPGPMRLAWHADVAGRDVVLEGELSASAGRPGPGLDLRCDPIPGVRSLEAPWFVREDRRVRFRLHWQAVHPLLARVAVPETFVGEPLGLARRTVEVAGDPLTIGCYPPEASRIGHIPVRRTTTLPGETPAAALGRSGDFFGVRPAGPGDEARQINPRASARLGRLCVNEFRPERSGDLVIVIDARPTSLGPASDRALLAMARAGALGLAHGFLDAKHRVGLAVFGEYLETVPLGTGRHQRWQIEALLARTEIAELGGPAERLAVSMRRSFPPGVPTLLVCPLVDEESFLVLPHLRRRGFPAVVLSPSPIPLIASALQGDAEERLLMRLLRLVRRNQVARAWREAPTLDWEEYWHLEGLRGLLRAGSGASARGLR